MKQLKTISVIALAVVFNLSSLSSQARVAVGGGGSEAGGGGDEVGLEFQSSFVNALLAIQSQDQKVARQIRALNPMDLLLNARILTVDEDLNVQQGGTTQRSVAKNIPATDTIFVNRARWGAIQDARIKQGIALHEVLSLRGIEATGIYPISGLFVASIGLKTKVLTDGGLRYESAFDRYMREKNATDAKTRRRTCAEIMQAGSAQQAVDRANSAMNQGLSLCRGDHESSSLMLDLQNFRKANIASQSEIGDLMKCSKSQREMRILSKVFDDLVRTELMVDQCVGSLINRRP